jgi:hypothetical protein
LGFLDQPAYETTGGSASAARRGSLSDAFRQAGLAGGVAPVSDGDIQSPVAYFDAETPTVTALMPSTAVTAASTTVPVWMKAARRNRWRRRLSNGVAWLSTLAIVALLITAAAYFLGAIHLDGGLTSWR